MIDKTNLRIETVNEYCIVNGKNEIVKDGFYSEEEAAEWLEEVYGVKHERKSQPKISGWIPCKERLPEVKGWYLVYAKNQRPFVAYFKGKTFPLNNHYHEIIAWQPLPEPYKG